MTRISNCVVKHTAQAYLCAEADNATPSGACGSACGAGDSKTEKKPTACGSACGAGDAKPEEKPAACGSACGSACGAGEK